ncbi:MAG: hypothetical protein JWP69_829 [Flaviaesturariibacter sp.]|nr:hypothetical protein [Flaviaesturariibacter sp.]
MIFIIFLLVVAYYFMRVMKSKRRQREDMRIERKARIHTSILRLTRSTDSKKGNDNRFE